MITGIRIPERYEHVARNSKNYIGFIGLSVGKVDFETPNIMNAYCQFMQHHFLYGIFMIGDYPKKYNIMALDGGSEKKAEERPRVAGDNMRNNLEKVTRDYPFVKVARYKHFMTPLYQTNLTVLQTVYVSNLSFQRSANEIVDEFLNIPTNLTKWRGIKEPPASKVKDYLLDELALLTSAPFSFPLPVCEIYPGRNELQEQVQQRQFPFCKDLHIKDDRVFMEAYYESDYQKV